MKRRLTKLTTVDKFKAHYWLKVELISFCVKHKISAIGSKQALAERIEIFLATGKKAKSTANLDKGERDSAKLLTRETLVVNYKNDAATRAFFVSHIGKHFHFDHYLRQFTDKNNITEGLTYGDLVSSWLAEDTKRKSSTDESKIGKQFEYNQFTRDFFQNEPESTRAEMIAVWNYIKKMSGERTYAAYRKIKVNQK